MHTFMSQNANERGVCRINVAQFDSIRQRAAQPTDKLYKLDQAPTVLLLENSFQYNFSSSVDVAAWLFVI